MEYLDQSYFSCPQYRIYYNQYIQLLKLFPQNNQTIGSTEQIMKNFSCLQKLHKGIVIRLKYCLNCHKEQMCENVPVWFLAQLQQRLILQQLQYAYIQHQHQHEADLKTHHEVLTLFTNIFFFIYSKQSVDKVKLEYQNETQEEEQKIDLAKSQEDKPTIKSVKEDLVLCVQLIIEHLEDVDYVQRSDQFILSRPHLGVLMKILEDKFKSIKKSREEIIKFCMRKAFKFLFKCLKQRNQKDMNLKKANIFCMSHYFKQDQEFVLPFRKNCKIRTMNNAFLEQVFSSETFTHDYKIFLCISIRSHYDEQIVEDNQKKIENVAENLLNLYQNNRLDKIKTMRRLPWTLGTLKEAKKTAFQLLKYSNQ